MDQLTHVRRHPAAETLVAPPADRMQRVIVAGLLVATAMLTLLAAGQLINYGVFNLKITAIDTDSHASVFGVASLAAELAAAAAIWWRSSRVQRHRWLWVVLGALVAVLIPVRLGNFNAATLAVPLACVFWLVAWLTRRDPRAARRVVWGALILMIASLFLHQVGLDADVTNYSSHSWGYQISAVAKHGCELAGWILLLTGIIAGVESRPASQVSPPDSVLLELESVTQ